MNKPAKHTPGPWFSGCRGSKDIQVVADDNSMAPVGTSSLVIAKVNASVEGVEANAALIAAAPAMYAWIAKVCKDGLSFEDIKEGRALLSQTEGVDHA